MSVEPPLIRDIINGVLNSRIEGSQFGAAFPYTQLTTQEAADGITPGNYGYPYGDPRRRGTGYTGTLDPEDIEGWFDYGHVPTYINATSFSVPGNQTARYLPFNRTMGVGASSQADLRVVSAVFGAVTTVTVTNNDTGDTLPNPMTAVWVQRLTSAQSVGNIRFNANLIAGLEIVNAASGNMTASRFCARTLDSSGVTESAVCLVAVSPSYSGAYLSGGFSSGARAVLYTPPTMSLEIGTSDVARATFPNDASPIGFTSDVAVSRSVAAATISVSGSTSGRLSLRSNSAEVGYAFANSTEVQIGSTTAVPVAIIYGASRAIQFNGLTSIGASTGTFTTANKPGANNGVIAWQSVLTSAGVQGWIPVIGN